MYNYLSSVAANYDYTLTLISQVEIPVTSSKTQSVHKFDDGSMVVVGLSSQSYFDAKLQWKYITSTDKNILMSLWNDPLKADGIRRTFYWTNPDDSRSYTIRFMSELVTVTRPGVINKISEIAIRIEGNKP